MSTRYAMATFVPRRSKPRYTIAAASHPTPHLGDRPPAHESIFNLQELVPTPTHRDAIPARQPHHKPKRILNLPLNRHQYRRFAYRVPVDVRRYQP